jgi:hypothetical protein
MGGAPAETTRGSRDRLNGQPLERQHSAAEGGTRDRLPPASDSKATSRLVGINFAFAMLSQCCACRCTACACSLSQFFYRGRHGQESEEGKEDREGSHQEGGKEDLKEKEVIEPTTERLRLRVATRKQSQTSPKDLKCPLQLFGIAALCDWLLLKRPVFRPDEGHDPEGPTPHRRDALAARFTGASSAKCGTRPTTSFTPPALASAIALELFVEYLITQFGRLYETDETFEPTHGLSLDRTGLSASCPVYPRSGRLGRTSRIGSFGP